MRPPGLWGGCRGGPPEAGGGAGTRRHCGDEPATAPRRDRVQLRAPGARAGPARTERPPGAEGRAHRSLAPDAALAARFPGRSLPARSGWPAWVCRGRRATSCRETRPSHPHMPPRTRASANPGWLDFDEDELRTSPYFQKWKTYGPLRNTSCRLGYWSRSGISVIFNIRVGVAWPQTRCPHCGLTIPHPGDSSPLPIQGTKPKSLAVPPFCQEK